MSDPLKQERIEEFLRHSLLGDVELVNTQFHLYSARSSSSGGVVKPRVLCANNALLVKSSKYFSDLLSSDENPSDPSLVDVTDDNDVPDNAQIDDYGYESDSDLDDSDDPVPDVSKGRSAAASTCTSEATAETPAKDDEELSDDGSESASSDIFVITPELEVTSSLDENGVQLVASSEAVVQDNANDNKVTANPTAMRLRSLGSRHILVKDTAFRTWYALLNYLYTDKFYFMPLGSVTQSGQPPKSSTTALGEPRCSAKSMYRLASKVGLDHIRDKALSHIRSNLTEHNVLKELSSSLASRHPQLLEMELDVLYSHITSVPVVRGLPVLARRIANKELLHGADIVIGIHARLVEERGPLAFKPEPGVPACLSISLGPSEPRMKYKCPELPSASSDISTEASVHVDEGWAIREFPPSDCDHYPNPVVTGTSTLKSTKNKGKKKKPQVNGATIPISSCMPPSTR